MNPKSIAFHHFGCKVNFAESSALSRKFRDKGYDILNFKEKADIYIISSCIVTGVAEKKCRAAIRQAHKINPEAKIAVIGCFSELKPHEIEKIEGVDLILGHQEKFNLLEQIEYFNSKTEPSHPPQSDPVDNRFIPSWSYGDRTRSFLKIQDGCDYYCAYCTIPLARGHSRSDTIKNVVKNAIEITEAGVKEIILTGVNIGDFGRHNHESLSGLIRELDKIKGLQRIRLSSIEPDLLTDEIIDFIAGSGKFMPHFHVPLQSGSDKILVKMKRKYDTSLYISRIQSIKSKLPDACIASDVIVGFPGETEEDFRETYSFLEHQDLSYMHVFSYSPRENTLALTMDGLVQDKIKKDRSDTLRQLSEDKKDHFYLMNQGMERNVLFESGNTNGFMHGFTENYIKVKTRYRSEYINRIIRVKLEKLDADGTYVI
jgi:threonylcarbamoyladenosine tRNA methylthiotransferase MtaB